MLRAAVIIDYQNMHTTGVHVFERETKLRGLPLNPVKFSEALIEFRNSRATNTALLAEIAKVEVYRGLPSSTHDPKEHAANLEQKKRWTQDPRLGVFHRDMKYDLTPSNYQDEPLKPHHRFGTHN